MKSNGGVVVPGQTDTKASTEQVLAAHLAQQSQVNRELAAMFAAVLKSKHNGKVFVPSAIAEECYGDAAKNHGWLVMITNLGPLGTWRVQAYTPDQQPYVPPAEEQPGSAKDWLRTEIEKGHVAVLGSLPQAILNQVADLMEQYKEQSASALSETTSNGPEPVAEEPESDRSKEICEKDWHKNGVGLRCPDCGGRGRITTEELVSA